MWRCLLRRLGGQVLALPKKQQAYCLTALAEALVLYGSIGQPTNAFSSMNNAQSGATGPFIDDVAPPAQKTLWFGILYLFPTVGIAGGYIFGGVIGISMGWRMPFLLQVREMLSNVSEDAHRAFGLGCSKMFTW